MGLPFVHTVSSSLPPSVRFDWWRFGMGGTYEAELPEGMRPEDFAYDISVWKFGNLLLNDVSFAARLQRRTPHTIRSDRVDHYRLLLQTEGELRSEADDRRQRVRPGQLLITDLAREECYETDGGANIVLFIPRETLDEALPRPLDLHGLVPQGALALILASHLRSLVAASPELGTDDTPGLVSATVQLLAAAVSQSAQALDNARPATEVLLLRQVCRYIDLHVSDTDLSPDKIAASFRLSRATLYRLFEPLGGVSSHVKERRLLRIRELLLSSGGRVYLERLAEDHGFTSAAHFSRAFKQHFGYSPSEARQRMDAALPPDPGMPAEGTHFGTWLRGLRD